ncbi:MAG: GNAT family N-acetyltransferase [Actinomycetes bacterium]
MTLREGPVTLRPIRRRDRAAWLEVRGRNLKWLAPWEATPPREGQPIAFPTMVRTLRRQARRGQMMPFVVLYEGRLVGQLTVGGITWGSLCAAHIGYWIDSRVAGRGIMPTAVALATDHCLTRAGLHRIEVNIRPENAASLRVVEKLGFRDEGLRRGFLHIAGDWRDHRTFALTAEELPPGGLVSRIRVPKSHESHSSQD